MNEDEIKIEGEIDIDQALAEFERKASIEQIQKNPETKKTSDVPKLVLLVMKYSGVKETRQAEYILLGLVGAMIALSLFLFFGRRSSRPQIPPPRTLQMIQPTPLNN